MTIRPEQSILERHGIRDLRTEFAKAKVNQQTP